MELVTVNAKRAKEIQAKSNDTINFEIINDQVKTVSFPGPDGTIYLKIDSYSVLVCEQKHEKKWELRQGDKAPQFFDTKEEAFRFVDAFNFDTISIQEVIVEG